MEKVQAMKVLIDIPDKEYQACVRRDANMTGGIADNYIATGTVLQNGHGDLISRSELKKAFEEDMKCGGVKINEFDKGYDLGIKRLLKCLTIPRQLRLIAKIVMGMKQDIRQG